MVVLRSTSGLHMGEFDGAEAIAALGFDRRSQQKAVFWDVNAHIRQFLGSGFLKNGSSKFRQTAVGGDPGWRLMRNALSKSYGYPWPSLIMPRTQRGYHCRYSCEPGPSPYQLYHAT